MGNRSFPFDYSLACSLVVKWNASQTYGILFRIVKCIKCFIFLKTEWLNYKVILGDSLTLTSVRK